MLVVRRWLPGDRDVSGSRRAQRWVAAAKIAGPAVGAGLEEHWASVAPHVLYGVLRYIVEPHGVDRLGRLGVDPEGAHDIEQLAGAQVRATGLPRRANVVFTHVEHGQLPEGREVERLVDGALVQRPIAEER